MRICPKPILCSVVTVVLSSVGLTHADEPLRLESLPLTASDIAAVTGLDIYKFRIAMKPGTKCDVAVSVIDAPHAKPRFMNRHTLTSDDDARVVNVLLSFLPRDHTLRGMLLSQDEEIASRVVCPQCSPRAFRPASHYR